MTSRQRAAPGAGALRAASQLLKAEGFALVAPPLREFTKTGGGPHCLTFEVRRDR